MKYIIAILLILICPPSFADSPANFTGTVLYNYCTEGKGTQGDTICLAYIKGVTDGLFFAASLNDTSTKICMLDKLPSVIQTRLIVEKFMRDHPEKLNKDAAIISGMALFMAFPCEDDKPKN